LRKIVENNPAKSYINVYRNFDLQYPTSNEITGCVFSKDGTEIVATALNNFIYVFDVNTNFAKLYNMDYFGQPPQKRPRRRSSPRESQEKENQSPHNSPQELEEEETTCLKTYKNVYKGHYSSKTIKAVNFYGPDSEFVISGSDDAKIYIWDKKTTELLTILECHQEIVNCIVGHPTQPMIASSGIDTVVKLWQNVNDYPSLDQLKHRKQRIEKTITDNNNLHTQAQEPNYESFCVQQ